MKIKHDTRLTSAELTQLWANYQNDTMMICIFRHFLKTVQDPNIASVLEKTIEYPKSHIPQLVDFFNGENWPVPLGFTDSDVNMEAPRLYSDSFMLYYLHYTSATVLNFFSTALALSTREDVRSYFITCIGQAINLNKMTNSLLLEKGLYIRSPYLSPPPSIDFVTDRHFLGSWFGENRPLVSMEITNLYSNLQRNSLGKALMMGFSQVAEGQEIRKFMMRGKQLADKHVEIFDSKLSRDDLPNSIPWDLTVTDSIVAPFSDKLMMFHTTALIGISIGYYGLSIGTSLRKDITTDYVRITAEIAKFAEDGAKIMIDNGWMEEPPQAANRNQLANQT